MFDTSSLSLKVRIITTTPSAGTTTTVDMSSGSSWYDALPTPKSSAREMTTSDLKEILDTVPTSIIVVDVRRADIEVSHIVPSHYSSLIFLQPPLSLMLPRAINLPAQTFYQTLPVTIDLLIK